MTVVDFNKQRQARGGLRPLPYNQEAEQALLGALMINNDAFYRVADFLLPEHFFEPTHREIFEITAKLIRAGKTATPITLPTFFPAGLDIYGQTIKEYLAYLSAEATTIINAGDYGRVVYDMARRRSLISIAERMADAAYNAAVEATPEAQVDDAERALFELAETGKYGAGFQTFSQAVAKAVDLAARAYQRDGGLSGLATGLVDLDNLMGGLQASDVIVLAGRPGMGKTALATNIAYNVAERWRAEADSSTSGASKTVDGGIVGFFSLEMSAEQLATRIISEQSGIPSNKIRRGAIDGVAYDQIVRVATAIQTLPLYIDECGGLSIAQIAARARRLKRTYGLDLLVIDYLQLATGTTQRSSRDRVAEVTEITTRLKALAKELNVPVLALSQLSRAVEARDDKRPQLTDLRESGSIEQDADVVLFVHREEYYHALKKPPVDDAAKMAEWIAKSETTEGKAEIIIGKQRHGPIGTVELQFDASVTRFANLAKGDAV
jgi:replicative DNA helicase